MKEKVMFSYLLLRELQIVKETEGYSHSILEVLSP